MHPVRFRGHTASEKETEHFAQALGGRIKVSMCISLVGNLGAGKTTFVRGLCRGLGVEEAIISPTFILYEAFEGRMPVVHLDLYRLEHESEIEALGVFDLLGTDTVVVVEWGDRSPALYSESDVVLEIQHTGDSERTITCRSSANAASIFEGAQSW